MYITASSNQTKKILRKLIHFANDSRNAVGECDLRCLDEGLSTLIFDAVNKMGYIFETLVVASEYYRLHGEYERTFDVYFKAYRLCMRDPDVNHSLEKFEKYADYMASLVDFYTAVKQEQEMLSNSANKRGSSENFGFDIGSVKHKISSLLHSFTEKIRVYTAFCFSKIATTVRTNTVIIDALIQSSFENTQRHDMLVGYLKALEEDNDAY